MVNAPTYYTVSAAAFLLGYFSGQFEKSAYVVVGFLALFFLAFANIGHADIGVSPFAMTASHYFLSIIAASSMWAFSGMLLSKGLNNMKFLNHFTLLVTKARNEKLRKLPGKVWPFWAFLILAFGSFVVYELQDITYWARTFLGIGILLVAWAIFYFLYKNETSYYSSSKPGTTTQSIVFTLVWIPAAILFVYGLIYLILDFMAQHNYPTTFGTAWFDHHWNFYSSLIGAALPAAIGIGLWRGDWKKRTKIGKTLQPDEVKEWVQAKQSGSLSIRL